MANRAKAQASIGNGQTLNADAAVYWNALARKILEAEHYVIVPTEGTRAYERQMYLWVNRNKPGFNPAWHPDDARAYHVAGNAVDVGSYVGYSNKPQYSVFRRYAGQYGFRETVQGEPWHFEWRREWATVNLDTAGSRPTPIETPEEPKELFVTAHTMLVHPEGQVHIIEGVPLDLGPGNAGSIKIVSGSPTTRIDCSTAVANQYVARARRDLEERVIYKQVDGGYAILDKSAFRIMHHMDAVNALVKAGVQVVEINANEFNALAQTFPQN